MKYSALLRCVSVAACSLALSSAAARATSTVHRLPHAQPLVQHVIQLPGTNGVQVALIRATIPPGGSTGWHVHLYAQTSYLLSGRLVLQRLNGTQITSMSPGRANVEPAGIVMRATNPSKTVPAVILLFQVTLPGAPAVKSWGV